ncbi:integral membrane protein PTH11 [Fusarium sp. NRRL 25303]|nr:integral membrane protein PTH11 [Fusarium sp. NRRL 25303]
MSGWTYNAPSGSPTDGPQITSIAVVFTAVALLTVLLRVYVRGFMLKSVGADDWIIIATWIASCGFAVVTVIQTKWGLGLKKLDDLPQQNYYNFMLVRKQWDLSITHGSCLKGVPMYTTMASITIVFDVVVMMLPFPTLLKLQMPNRKKVVLLGLFAMGIFISIIQIVRIQTIKSLSNLLDSAGLIKWSMVENNLGIIVACVPTLAPLVRYFSEQSRVGSRSRSKSQNNSGYALQSTYRKNLSRRSGLQPLGSGVDEQIGDSAEDILAKEDGIMRKTEIVISSAQGPADRGELTPGHYHGR